MIPNKLRSKPLPSVHLLGTGTPRCAGCGGLEAAPWFVPLHKFSEAIMILSRKAITWTKNTSLPLGGTRILQNARM